MSYDWNQLPHVLAERRKLLVEELITTDDLTHTVGLRAQIRLLKELERLPITAQEERDFLSSTGREDDDD